MGSVGERPPLRSIVLVKAGPDSLRPRRIFTQLGAARTKENLIQGIVSVLVVTPARFAAIRQSAKHKSLETVGTHGKDEAAAERQSDQLRLGVAHRDFFFNPG